ncbi:AAA family ATPase [Gordonia jinghuaiqii]|uniref:ATP-binding protein n=1 Tax=Gordonia jinghuaiqii TaxID=2758710 RepID=A0A7D7M0C3_9ACTN|nr:AAA domain-containing protein [Gordonia jinghuaiqii]MCR5980521.1 AAA family ATPase [Gordonia jinghuaiqii]QMT03314.1 ATP-binding protein [Gordonia jinghuaiqii]
MQDDARETLRDQVTRLMSFLRDLVRSRSGDVRDIDDHPGSVWVGPSTPVSVRPNAAPGQVVLEIAPPDPDSGPSDSAGPASDSDAYADLARLIDELTSNPESLELVVANALVTVRDEAGADVEPLVREHLLTQAVVADRDESGTIRLSLGVGSAPTMHDTHLLASVDGLDLAGAVKVRTKLSEQASVLSNTVTDLIGEWLDAIDIDTGRATLTLDMRPAVVLRRRGVDTSLAFYDAIIDDLRDETSPVPIGLAQLVAPIESDARLDALDAPGVLAPDALTSDALFPLPSNVEQRDVLARLGVDSGVVVEGPPGTGKTHTIANVTSALLAKGQRVLVVSEKAHALHVLRDMLPPPLRDLAVSIADVSQDRSEGVVAAVAALAERKSAFSPGVADAEIADLTARRDHALRRRDEVLRELWDLRAEETEVHEWIAGDYRGTPAQVVRQVLADADRFDWMPGPLQGSVPPLDSGEFVRLVELLGVTGGSAARLSQRFPDLDDHLPEPGALDAICARIAARPHEPMTGAGSLLSVLDGVDSARLLRVKDICDQLAVASAEVSSYPAPMVDMADRLLAGRATHLWSRVTTLSPVIAEAARRDRDLGAHAVVVDGHRPGDAALFDAAADFLRGGGQWRGRLRRSAEQRAVEESPVRATVDGRVPADEASLRRVADHLTVLDAVQQVHRILADLHVPVDASGSRSAQLDHLVRLDTQLSWISRLVTGRDHLVRELESISPGGPRPRSVAEVAQIARQARSIAAANDAVLAEQELADFAYRLSAELERGPSPEGDALVAALAAADADAIRSARRAFVTAGADAAAQNALDLLGLRLRSRAPELAKLLWSTPDDPAWVDRARDMGAAWAWRFAHSWVQDRSDPLSESRLQAALDALEVDIAQLTTRLASAQAWRALSARTSAGEMQALQSYRDHMINLGKGSGKHANRFRRAAREAMHEAQNAIPAWIMSINQVAETLPPRRNSFDVVIVDEASQADITSSFLLWLAPRVIVVGDDKQCAPVGLSGTTLDDAFAELDAALPDLPTYLRDGLTPRSSLFSLLRSRFGNVVALREHFRSMPEIIGFSSQQFYGTSPLIPVRQYGSDRLEPLRAVAVDGEAIGTGGAVTNEAEVTAILSALRDCLDDPAYDGMDFGVIALQGTRQVEALERTLRAEIDAETWRERRIRVGSPPDFQGDERHVMFLSMVVSDPAAISALTRAESQRRFNVAATRAMDQLWLFHSVDPDELRRNDLRYSLLSYVIANEGPVISPMPTDVPDDRRVEPFDSLLEQQVFNRLAALGYHVSPKVVVNNRVVDLVVLGADARMAVECDADRFPGTGRQARSDLERERELRRCGWEFVRVRESEFEFDRDGVIDSVAAALDARGCKPGSLAAAGAGSTQSESFRSLGDVPVWTPIDLTAGE